MKVLERVLEKRIGCQVLIDNMHFGFMSGNGTMGARFTIFWACRPCGPA